MITNKSMILPAVMYSIILLMYYSYFVLEYSILACFSSLRNHGRIQFWVMMSFGAFESVLGILGGGG